MSKQFANIIFVLTMLAISSLAKVPIRPDINTKPLSAGIAPIYEGYHDDATCDKIFGWAWDKNQPNTPISVVILDGTNYIATVSANEYRADLAGIGNGQHAFNFPTPASLKDGKSHNIRIYFSGNPSQDLTNSPKTLPVCGSAPTPPTFTTSPSSGTQTITSFSYNGANLTPNGIVQRFTRRPDGTVVDLGNMNADAAGNYSWSFTYKCTDAVGRHAVWIRDVTKNLSSAEVYNDVSASSNCLPDLTISASTPNQVSPNQTLQIPTTVNRTGGSLTLGSYVLARLYWSTNSVFDSADTQLWQSNGNTDFLNSILNTNGTHTVNATITVPSSASSGQTYYLIAVADADFYHPESNENNNIVSYPVTISNINPPALSTISPTTFAAAKPFDLQLTGTLFDLNTIQVTILGNTCTPACVILNESLIKNSGSQITAPKVQLNDIGTYQISVRNGANGASSNSKTFTTTAAPASDFVINVTPAVTITQGATAYFDVSITSRNGFTDTVSLTVQNLPSGYVLQGTEFYPKEISVPANQTVQSQLRIFTNSSTATGQSQLTINAKSKGGLTQSSLATLTINAPGVSPAINSISPATVIHKQATTLTVNGNNLQDITKIQVSTPLGIFPNNASLPINIVNSGQLTTQVTMDGTPPYTATLILTNSKGQSASYPFQVVLPDSATPAIASITPNPIPFEQEIELVVNGNNFQNTFSATVFSPAGKVGGDVIDPSGLRFINSNQVRVKVTMRGTPTYTARLVITVNGKSAESTFQVIKPIANNPVFTVVPSQGARGTTFTNSGKLFTPNQKVIVSVEWAAGSNVPNVDGIIRQADANGDIASWNYVSKTTDPLGIHTLKVRDYVTNNPITSAQVNYTNSSNGDVISVLNNAQNFQADASKTVTVNWTIKNTGSTTFDSRYKIVRIDTNAVPVTVTRGSLFSILQNGTAAPGATIPINLNFTTPATKGAYATSWQLQNSAGQNFGPILSANINVIAANKSKTGNGTQASAGTGDSNNSKANFNSDPVNTANGNYVYDREDLHIPGRGMDFVFSRFYNSLDITSSTLGNGWSHSFNISLGDINTENPVVRYSDGKVLEYEKEAPDTYLPRIPGFYDKLVKNPDSTWSLLKSDQRNYNFDANGKLVVIQDRNNNYLALAYGGNGQLQDIIDTVGRKYSFGYNGQQLATLTDPASRTIAFAYDSAGNLSTFKDANGNTMQYFYDANNRITRIVDGRTNNVLVNEYDEVGRVKSQTNGRGNKWQFGYNTELGETTILDPMNKPTKDQHDQIFNLNTTTNTQSKTAGIGYDTNGNRNQTLDLNGSVQSFAYDQRGNLISSVNPNQNARQIQYDLKNNPMMIMDELNRPTAMEYDQKGNLIMLKDAMNQAVQMIYNQYGQPETLTDPNGNQTKLAYDNQGNLKTSTNVLGQTTTFEYDAVGRRTKIIDARGKTTSFVYDYNDNVTSVTDPSGKTTNYKYDANDNLIEATNPRGKITRYDYDQDNLLIKETDAFGKTIEYTYDELDRRKMTKDKRGNISEFGYDSEGRLTSVKDPNGFTTKFEYDANGNRTKVIDPSGQASEFTYDALNRVIQTKDPLGNTTQRVYDAASQLIEEIDQRDLSTKFKYDDVGNLKEVNDAAGGKVIYGYDKNRNRISVADPNNHTATTTFDKLNRVETTQDPLNNKYVYTYDEVGNRKTMTDAKGQIIKYDYDNNNRLTTITYPDNSTVTFSYDENGNVLEMKDAVGTTKYVYDDLNRVTTYTDAYGKIIGYEYDENGNIKTLIYPDGKRVAYEFDKGNRMISVTDWLGKVTRYDYDERNLVKKATNGNGTTATYSYDVAGRLTGLVNAKSDGTIISSYAYELDKNGNRLKAAIQEPIPPTVGIAPQTATFDEANRIKTASTSTFTFDANGNMTGKTTRGITTAFNWDFNDRLTAVGNTTAYFYNGVGTRLAKREGANTTRYVVDANRELSQLLCETDGSGVITNYYIYGLGLISLISSSGNYYSYHADTVGSIKEILDQEQRTVSRYSYDAFGRVISRQESVMQLFNFIGSYGVVDDKNNLSYIRARYYLPELGRFISKDLLSAKIGNGQEINRYTYSQNNPLSKFDPTGLLTIFIPGTEDIVTPGDYEKLKEFTDNNEGKNFLSNVCNSFGESVSALQWSGGNTKGARSDAAKYLSNYINNYSFSDGEKLNIVAHSHGGNIAFLTSQKINRKIDTLVTLGTPIRNDYAPNRDNIGLHLNVYSNKDGVQTNGGRVQSFFPFGGDGAKRTSSGAVNIDATEYASGDGYIDNHSLYWKNPNVWLKLVAPRINTSSKAKYKEQKSVSNKCQSY